MANREMTDCARAHGSGERGMAAGGGQEHVPLQREARAAEPCPCCAPTRRVCQRAHVSVASRGAARTQPTPRLHQTGGSGRQRTAAWRCWSRGGPVRTAPAPRCRLRQPRAANHGQPATGNQLHAVSHARSVTHIGGRAHTEVLPCLRRLRQALGQRSYVQEPQVQALPRQRVYGVRGITVGERVSGCASSSVSMGSSTGGHTNPTSATRAL